MVLSANPVRCANTRQTPEPLIRVGTGAAGDYVLLAPCRRAAASAARHTLHRSYAFALQRQTLPWPHVAPTTAIRTPLYRACRKQHLCSLFSVRTQQSEKAVVTGDTRPGESSGAIPAIPDSSLFAEPANWHGLCRRLRA